MDGVCLPPDRIRFDGPAPATTRPMTSGWPPSPRRPSRPPRRPPDVVVLNEFLPSPRDIDFDGNGEADLRGRVHRTLQPWRRMPSMWAAGCWMTWTAAASPIRLPPGTILPPRASCLFFRSVTGIALNNNDDSVRLLAPDGDARHRPLRLRPRLGDVPWSRTIRWRWRVDGIDIRPAQAGPNLPPAGTPTHATPSVHPDPHANARPQPDRHPPRPRRTARTATTTLRYSHGDHHRPGPPRPAPPPPRPVSSP